MVSSSASASPACAVWPSCHRNSVVLRNIRGLSSQRTTFDHWFRSRGRSREEEIHPAIVPPTMVSDGGRTTRGSRNPLPPRRRAAANPAPPPPPCAACAPPWGSRGTGPRARASEGGLKRGQRQRRSGAALLELLD